MKHLDVALRILRNNNLYAKKSNVDSLNASWVLRSHISGEGISVDPKKIEAINNWEPPHNVKQVQSFLGLCNYYRKFVKDFAKIAAPLTNLTKKITHLNGKT